MRKIWGAAGLAAFALTTFLLSAKNANWMTHATGNAFLGYAFAYGGLCQLLAGMWEFRNRNVFGATAFSTYGGFWIGIGLWFNWVAVPALTAAAKVPRTLPATAAAVNHDLGWILFITVIWSLWVQLLAIAAAISALSRSSTSMLMSGCSRRKAANAFGRCSDRPEVLASRCTLVLAPPA